MDIDEDKIDDAALAIISMSMDWHRIAWKQVNWSITNRLYEKGYIHNPLGKTKSIIFTEEGEAKAEEVFKALFCKGN
ncbi:MAG: hypothetical protein ACJAXM_000279 [Arenicella sp.]|jgi:hypothetical protein